MPHFGRMYSPWSGMITPCLVPSATVLPALLTQTKRAEPDWPMVSVHWMVIQLSRSGPSGVEAMVGEPELA